MSFLFQAEGALPATHPAYALRQEADNTAFVAAINGQILHVIAPRQVGKTSLLRQLRHRLAQDGWNCAYVDLSVLMNLTESNWYAELGKLLASELTSEYIPTLRNHIELRHYLTAQIFSHQPTSNHVAVFFDEIESVLKVQGFFSSDAFFMTIRNIYNERDTYKGNVVIALAGAISPGNLVKDQSISPFNVGQKISLNDFTLEESKLLTSHLSELGLPVEASVYQTIYEWTNGHPYLTHSICFELERLARNNNLTNITSKSVMDVINCIFLFPGNPLLQDSNIRHVTRMLKTLPEPTRKLSLRLQKEKALLMEEIDSDTYLDLYLTGAFKVVDNHVVIRNHIYEKVFLKEERGDEPAEAEKALLISHPQMSIEKNPYSSTTPKMGQHFLQPSERKRITEVIEMFIENMSVYEIKNFLINSHISSGVISHNIYKEGSRSIAHALVWNLERAGLLSTTDYHALGSLLISISESSFIGFDAAIELILFVFKYHLVSDHEKVRKLSSQFQLPLPRSESKYQHHSSSFSHIHRDVLGRLKTQELEKRLETLFNKGIRHYNDPRFLILGAKAIRSVCRVEFDNRGEGSGFLIAPDLVLTNYHVMKPIGYQGNIHERAKRCRIRFGAMRNNDGSVEAGRLLRLHEQWLIAYNDSLDLDFMLVKLEHSVKDNIILPATLASTSKHLQEEDFVNIIHHPQGGPMEVSLRYNQIVGIEEQRIYYLADTEEGSSGSPVFDDEWNVVALHRSGGERDKEGILIREANAGIPVGLILEKIGLYLDDH